jgi:hypothetical protein
LPSDPRQMHAPTTVPRLSWSRAPLVGTLFDED